MSPPVSATQTNTKDTPGTAESSTCGSQPFNYALAVRGYQPSPEHDNVKEHKSPEKKRQKATRKRPLKEEIRLELEHQKSQRALTGIHQTMDEEHEWRSQQDHQTQMDLRDISTDLESRYNEHDDDATPPSPGRGYES